MTPNWRAAVTRGAMLLVVSSITAETRAQSATSTPSNDEIVVTGSIIATPRREIGTAVSVVDQAEIELRGYSDLADVLRTQPGIAVSNSGGPGRNTALRIRGEESYRTLLIIDGVKAVDPSGTQVAPSFDNLLVTNDLQRVEVLRGPQGFIYGADAGGVVNVITRSGVGPASGRFGVEYGDLGTRKLDAGLSGGGDTGDYFVSVTDLRTDGFNSLVADDVLADDDAAENTTVHAKLGWNATDDLRLQLVLRDIDADADYDGCYSAAIAATVHDCRVTTSQQTYRVSADYARGNFTHTVGYSNVDIERDNFVGNTSDFANEGQLGRFEYTGSLRPSTAATVVFGVDLQDEKIADAASTATRRQDGYYVEYQGRFAERFFLSLGARYDDNEDFGTHTSSRVSAAYLQELDSDRSLKYRASIGNGFRPPSLFEISYNRGPFAFPPASAVSLTEETSRGYDIGVEYNVADTLHIEVTYFDQRIEDEIFFDLIDFSGYLQSVGKSSSKGVELTTETALGERWRLLANWTRNDAENTTNEQRLRRPKNVANVGLLYGGDADRWRFALNYRLSRDAIDIGGASLDDYAVLDASMSFAFNETLELSARIQNATDEQYQEVLGFNTAGRMAFAGVRVRF